MPRRYSGTPLDSEWGKLKRRRELAQAITAQSLEPYSGTQTVTGHAVDDRWGQGLGKIGTAIIGAMANKRVDDESKELNKEFDTNRQRSVEKITGLLQGTPTPYEMSPDEQFGNEQIPGLQNAAKPPDRNAALLEAGTNPYLQTPGMQGVIGALTAKEARPTYKTVPEFQEGTGLWKNREVISGEKAGLVGGGYAKGPGASSTTQTTNMGKGETKLLEEMGKLQAGEYGERKKKAQDSVGLLQSSVEAKKLLDEGMTTGIFANVKVGLSKVLKDLGINFNDDPMVNAEAYMAASARRTLAIMPALGAGSALSDADRDYAERYVGGKITMSEDAIRKLMDINVRYSKGYVEDYNKDIGKLREWAIKNQPNSPLLLNMDPVEMPEIGSFVKDQEAPKVTLTPEKQAKFRERLKRERGE